MTYDDNRNRTGHARLHLHVMSTSASRFNTVERFFAEITHNRGCSWRLDSQYYYGLILLLLKIEPYFSRWCGTCVEN